ncbi:DUF951 domain-containing protein [Weissella koreensis]|uniref:DUF951 domain-containing protein n=1 Tax=Weissella koreensis TaxID=165096 RepID=A0A7H1MLQ0_9LACO|nr:DUF951 domain-containing protein [Weissella koreensis]AEJ23549.1 hypothetical protein WKK_03375 [Weissella koreensis KACC 15510]AVH75182.1 DUF951 domain-containing protein [Weissella koreensis]EJF33596.1 protein of hypothetical function DUF951 [Weissella koreensis KCTC 3621]MCZ9311043.1 DUF951 domain-containing protein [Weissella koreensis]QGN20407.1 DUF951 family protein [Weissella koreensis]
MYELSDIIEMKKPHACGTNRWAIIRIGADMKIKCQGCERVVMLSRHDFDRRFKKVLEKAN